MPRPRELRDFETRGPEGFYKSRSSNWSRRLLTYFEYNKSYKYDTKSPKIVKTMDFGETVVFQLSNGATSTATKSNGDIHDLPPTALESTPCTRWIPRFKVQLQWPSCSCAVYTLYLLFVCNKNVQFCKNKFIVVYSTLCRR